MDYLLLSYIIYHQGMSIPHIAAGINLNLTCRDRLHLAPRRGLFSCAAHSRAIACTPKCFTPISASCSRPVLHWSNFVEGGRSRTGRLLEPKGGMLSMTVSSYLADPNRPLYFVPVYFGYEKLLEGRSFIGEMSGEGKKKETLFALLRSLKKLKENFGEVYVNFGAPISLDDFIETRVPSWRELPGRDSSDRPDWLAGVIDDLGDEIMERINAAATVTPASLLALSLLGTPRQTMSYEDLARQIDFYAALAVSFPIRMRSRCRPSTRRRLFHAGKFSA